MGNALQVQIRMRIVLDEANLLETADGYHDCCDDRHYLSTGTSLFVKHIMPKCYTP